MRFLCNECANVIILLWILITHYNFALNFCYTAAPPPPSPPVECTSQGYTELNEASRYWAYDDGSTYCDRNLIISDQWYRFTGAAGVMMASYCIPQESCNTQLAGWINGKHPTGPYELVSTTACMHWSSSCCYLSFPAAIRKCDGFYVYKLQEPTGCYERYCGVNGKATDETKRPE